MDEWFLADKVIKDQMKNDYRVAHFVWKSVVQRRNWLNRKILLKPEPQFFVVAPGLVN
jgi:hypothetical protein